MEQIGVHFFLLLAKILFSTLVYDDHHLNMSAKSRWRMGYAVAFFIFLVILWNFLVLVWQLIQFLLKCKAARLGGVGGM